MLFDLRSGKRKRVVQVVYGGLAFLFFAGFVMFGIGSDVSGGLGDVLGLGDSSGTGQAGSQYEDQIDRAEERLAEDPKDTAALRDLATAHYFLGQLQLGQADPETGLPDVTSEAQADLGAAADAWERYLELEKRQADAGVAGTMVQAYILLNNAAGAARAQEVVAEDQPSSNTYGNLALFLYSAGEVGQGDAAAERAVAEASGAEREDIEKQLGKLRDQAIQYQKALEKAPASATGENPLQNPFGGFGTGATAP